MMGRELVQQTLNFDSNLSFPTSPLLPFCITIHILSYLSFSFLPFLYFLTFPLLPYLYSFSLPFLFCLIFPLLSYLSSTFLHFLYFLTFPLFPYLSSSVLSFPFFLTFPLLSYLSSTFLPFLYFLFFKFYSHNCYFYNTIQTIQIPIAATYYMSMFYLFFGIEKRVLLEKNTFRGEQK